MARQRPVRWTETLHRSVRTNWRWSLPLLLFGGIALVAGTGLYLQSTHAAPTRFPLWGLAVAIGVVGVGGGLLSLLFGDFTSEAERGIVQLTAEEMVVPKGEWLELRKRVEVLSQRNRDDSGSWAESEPPVSLTFMPVGTPPKGSNRRHGRGNFPGRSPMAGQRAPGEFDPELAPEPPAPPPAPVTDSTSGETAQFPRAAKPKPAADGS
ncbi:MAG: hypothetical protein L3K11_08605 [Thermoplasmata archaeon]|nr:hypothetical protein [Thermoplasmata archaeon]